jgi:hypothetical protein
VLRAAVSRRRIFGPVFSFTETVTAGRFKELSVNFISFWKLMNKTAGLSKKGLRHVQQSENCVRCVSYLVVALFIETCGPLDPRVYRRRISAVHLSFVTERAQEQPTYVRKIETKYRSVHFKRRCSRNLFTVLRQTWGKE